MKFPKEIAFLVALCVGVVSFYTAATVVISTWAFTMRMAVNAINKIGGNVPVDLTMMLMWVGWLASVLIGVFSFIFSSTYVTDTYSNEAQE